MRLRSLWLSASAGAAVGVATYFLKKKFSAASGNGSSGPRDGSGSPPAPAAAPRDLREASYSFISGFKDSATVEVRFSYDADAFSYSVQEDEFLVESGDSHVGILVGEGTFFAQFEYGTYYSGEDFAGLRKELSARHAGLTDAVYGTLSGVQFRDGDCICLAFPIPEDQHSYLLVTLVKAPDNDDELETLPDHPQLRALLESLSFHRS